MKLVNIGFGNLVNADRVVAIISPESAPAKRMIQECKERAQLIDATHGRKTKGVHTKHRKQQQNECYVYRKPNPKGCVG
jgi:regulator of extracellular matrix RemA (YlzA/DUF370 family)